MTSNSFHNAMNNQSTGRYDMTANGAVSYSTPDVSGNYDGRLAWFFKGIRGLNFVHAWQHLANASKESKDDAFCLVFNTRDVLKGKGERELSRKAFQWLLINYPTDMENVMHLIPEYGRWDDLYSLFPKVLNLTDRQWVNNNFCTNVSVQTLEKARQVQKNIVKLFTNQLQADWTAYQQSKPITLAAKWCETEGSGDDKRYSLVQQICSEWKLHPKGYRIRIGELRTALNIVEKLACGKKWNEIDYSKVPAQTMKKLKKAFDKNDPERFREWLQKLKKKDPTVKVNAKTLHPHELVSQYMGAGTGWSSNLSTTEDPVVEAQWNAIEETVRKTSALEKTIVVADVSGSMYSSSKPGAPRPVDVCLALAIMIARTSKAPWNDAMIAFSSTPTFHAVKGNSLLDMCRQTMNIEQGFNTDFFKVFKNILDRHDRYKLNPEDHPERVVVISDMQFDHADQNITNLDAIDNLYASHKPPLKRPTLVFWNVNSGLDFPATEADKNVCLIGGFSPSIMTALMTAKTFSPSCVLREVIDSDRYDAVRQALHN